MRKKTIAFLLALVMVLPVFVTVHTVYAPTAAQLTVKSVVQLSNGYNITLTLTNTGSNKISYMRATPGTSAAGNASIGFANSYAPDGWTTYIVHQSYSADNAYFSTYDNEYMIANGQNKDFTILASMHGFTLWWVIYNAPTHKG